MLPQKKRKINAIFVIDGSGARSLCTKRGDYKWMEGKSSDVYTLVPYTILT